MSTPEQLRRQIAAAGSVLVASKGCPPQAARQMLDAIQELMSINLGRPVRISVEIGKAHERWR